MALMIAELNTNNGAPGIEILGIQNLREAFR